MSTMSDCPQRWSRRWRRRAAGRSSWRTSSLLLCRSTVFDCRSRSCDSIANICVILWTYLKNLLGIKRLIIVCWFYFSCDVLFVVLIVCFQFYFLFVHYYYSVYCCIYANKGDGHILRGFNQSIINIHIVRFILRNTTTKDHHRSCTASQLIT